MHTGCQWKKIPITKNEQNEPKMHYTRVFRVFQRWVENGCFKKIFIHSVEKLFKAKMLKLEVIFGDGTATCAKKGSGPICQDTKSNIMRYNLQPLNYYYYNTLLLE